MEPIWSLLIPRMVILEKWDQPLFFSLPKVCCQQTASNKPPYHHTDSPTQPPAQPQQHNTWTHSRSCWTSQHPCRLVPPPEETSGIIGRLEEVYIYGSWFQVQTQGIGIFLFYFIFLKEKSIYNFFFFSSSNILIIILSFFPFQLFLYATALSVLPQPHLTFFSDATLTTKTKTKQKKRLKHTFWRSLCCHPKNYVGSMRWFAQRVSKSL